ADKAFIEATGTKNAMSGKMYANHDLDFLTMAASMEGNFAVAKEAADQLVATVTPRLQSDPMLAGALPTTIFVLVRFGRWDEIERFPKPDASLGIQSAVWHYARGVAFAAKQDTASARTERRELAVAVDNQPPEAKYRFVPVRVVLG